MYSDEDLDAAVSAGVLTPEAAAAFREFAGAQQASSVVNEEHFRLLTGFNDIFVSIAILLILIALTWIGGQAAPVLGEVLLAAASWGLGEYFTRRRRMALPRILLFLAFVGAVFVGTKSLLQGAPPMLIQPADWRFSTGPFAVAAVAAFMHWRRFMVPITVAVGNAVALVIDRRALLVSALFYVLYALSALFRAAGSLTFSLVFTALVIGSGLLLLSAFWHRTRVMVLRVLPDAIRIRLPST